MLESDFFSTERLGQTLVLKWNTKDGAIQINGNDLRAQLLNATAAVEPQRVVVNFSGLTICPSALVGALVSLGRQDHHDARLKICELAPWMRDKFNRLKLHHVFDFFDSLPEAIKACDTAPAPRPNHPNDRDTPA